MKHGQEYTMITSLEVGDELTEDHLKALGTLVLDDGTTPRTVFYEMDEEEPVDEGHKVI